MVELADTGDLKSPGRLVLAGSSPALGTGEGDRTFAIRMKHRFQLVIQLPPSHPGTRFRNLLSQSGVDFGVGDSLLAYAASSWLGSFIAGFHFRSRIVIPGTGVHLKLGARL